MKKNLNQYKILMAVCLLITVLVLTGCAPKATTPPTPSPVITAAIAPSAASAQGTTTAPAAQKTFTAAELSKFDGKNGNLAYIAIDGKVYDVTNVPQWAGGSHAGGRFQAGKDYTEELKSAPHSAGVLDGVPVVGTYTK